MHTSHFSGQHHDCLAAVPQIAVLIPRCCVLQVATASNGIVKCRTNNLPNPRTFGGSIERKFYTSSRNIFQWYDVGQQVRAAAVAVAALPSRCPTLCVPSVVPLLVSSLQCTVVLSRTSTAMQQTALSRTLYLWL